MSIPKIIHYCWFGGNELSPLALNCIKSWKKYCPDYQIIRWDESNFDININKYTQEAYKAEKWAFVSDVARLFAIVTYGGIYMDTDVEVIKPLDKFLLNDGFSGFESEDSVPTGIMASKKGLDIFKQCLEWYQDKRFINEDGSYNLTTNVVVITDILKKYNIKLNNTFQVINGLALYPKDYFCPKDYFSGEIMLTQNTHTIHHFNASWQTKESRTLHKFRIKCRKLFGDKVGEIIAKYIHLMLHFPKALKKNGVVGLIKKIFSRK